MLPLKRALLVLVVFLCAVPLMAQPTVAGGLSAQTGGFITGAPTTFIDFGRPVLSDGAMTNATFVWRSDRGDCGSKMRVRFFRAGDKGPHGPLTLVGQTAQFTPLQGLNHISFPAISVKRGDLLSVVQYPGDPNFGPNCGGFSFSDSPIQGDTLYQMNADYAGGGVSPVQLVRYRTRLNVVASGNSLHFGGVIPVVGSTKGLFNSFFRSSVMLTNDSDFTVYGRLVFRPAGAQAAINDPFVDYALGPKQSVTYPDFVQGINRTGLGTVDVYSNSYVPVVTVHVFNDAGASGTTGFTEELVRPIDMFGRASAMHTKAIITLPKDMSNKRMNVGIRTLGTAATLYTEFYSEPGVYYGANPVKRELPADFFQQITIFDLLGYGIIPPQGGMLIVYVTGGPVVLYTTTTDNITNDSSMNMVTWQ